MKNRAKGTQFCGLGCWAMGPVFYHVFHSPDLSPTFTYYVHATCPNLCSKMSKRHKMCFYILCTWDSSLNDSRNPTSFASCWRNLLKLYCRSRCMWMIVGADISETFIKFQSKSKSGQERRNFSFESKKLGKKIIRHVKRNKLEICNIASDISASCKVCDSSGQSWRGKLRSWLAVVSSQQSVQKGTAVTAQSQSMLLDALKSRKFWKCDLWQSFKKVFKKKWDKTQF